MRFIKNSFSRTPYFQQVARIVQDFHAHHGSNIRAFRASATPIGPKGQRAMIFYFIHLIVLGGLGSRSVNNLGVESCQNSLELNAVPKTIAEQHNSHFHRLLMAQRANEFNFHLNL